MEKKNKPNVCIVGNIGSGKSTFAKELFEKLSRKNMPASLYLEPVEEFKDINGVNMLQDLYDGVKFHYEFIFCTSLTKQRADCSPNTINIFEQSIETCIYVFADVDEKSFKYYEWFLNSLKKMCPNAFKKDLVIYLDVPIETCQQRIQKRGRKEEAALPIEYLQRLEDKFLVYLENVNAPVIKIKLVDSVGSKNYNDMLDMCYNFILNK